MICNDILQSIAGPGFKFCSDGFHGKICLNHINLIQITNSKNYLFAAKLSNLKFNIFKLRIRIWLFWPISRLKKPLACWGSRYAPAKVASSSAFVCMYVVLSSIYCMLCSMFSKTSS